MDSDGASKSPLVENEDDTEKKAAGKRRKWRRTLSLSATGVAVIMIAIFGCFDLYVGPVFEQDSRWHLDRL
jgi:hypothetical protein